MPSDARSFRLDELLAIVPPQDLAAGHGGVEQFRPLGTRWVETFQLIGGLEPHHAVLDVGCGPGRMALALAPLLGAKGRYEGFDVRQEDIEWCRREIEPRWPGSHFQWLDILNTAYRPDGKLSGHQVSFPYEDGQFDFVFLTSVFTHLVPETVIRYLKEVSRVLKPDGRCLATYFLMNDAVRRSIAAGKAKFKFATEVRPRAFYIETPSCPENAVAFEEEFLLPEYPKSGLVLQDPIHYGAWSGVARPRPSRHTQDFILAKKGPFGTARS